MNYLTKNEVQFLNEVHTAFRACELSEPEYLWIRTFYEDVIPPKVWEVMERVENLHNEGITSPGGINLIYRLLSQSPLNEQETSIGGKVGSLFQRLRSQFKKEKSVAGFGPEPETGAEAESTIRKMRAEFEKRKAATPSKSGAEMAAEKKELDAIKKGMEDLRKAEKEIRQHERAMKIANMKLWGRQNLNYIVPTGIILGIGIAGAGIWWFRNRHARALTNMALQKVMAAAQSHQVYVDPKEVKAAIKGIVRQPAKVKKLAYLINMSRGGHGIELAATELAQHILTELGVDALPGATPPAAHGQSIQPIPTSPSVTRIGDMSPGYEEMWDVPRTKGTLDEIDAENCKELMGETCGSSRSKKKKKMSEGSLGARINRASLKGIL